MRRKKDGGLKNILRDWKANIVYLQEIILKFVSRTEVRNL
jgi:hypothetical protein